MKKRLKSVATAMGLWFLMFGMFAGCQHGGPQPSDETTPRVRIGMSAKAEIDKLDVFVANLKTLTASQRKGFAILKDTLKALGQADVVMFYDPHKNLYTFDPKVPTTNVQELSAAQVVLKKKGFYNLDVDLTDIAAFLKGDLGISKFTLLSEIAPTETKFSLAIGVDSVEALRKLAEFANMNVAEDVVELFDNTIADSIKIDLAKRAMTITVPRKDK